MKEPLTSVFGNPIPGKYIRKAQRTFRAYARRFGFNPDYRPELGVRPLPGAWDHFGVRQIVPVESIENPEIPRREALPLPTAASRSVVLGTIRMGYGFSRDGGTTSPSSCGALRKS